MVSLKKTALLMLALCSIHAHAETQTFGDLDDLQGKRVYYEALGAMRKAKLSAGNADIGTVQAAPTGNNMAPGTPAPPVQSLPELGKVVGQTATLSLSDGTRLTVKAGDSVQGIYTVISVSINGVTIKRDMDGKTFKLS